MEVNEMVKFEESIREKIYSIRGFQVMLDRDLAELYGVKSEKVKRAGKKKSKKISSRLYVPAQ
jgi:hypothetical protein